MPLINWLRGFHPAGIIPARREAVLGSAGVAVSVYATEWLCHYIHGHSAIWFIAPMGATAVLLFFLPASPMAQPWPVAMGNLLGAAVGIEMMQAFGSSGTVAAAAAGLTCLLMMVLRCLNPPGIAVALTAVLGGQDVQALGFDFVLWPVAVNTGTLLLLAVIINNAAGRRYPHSHVPGPGDLLPTAKTGIIKEDLQAALVAYGDLLDVDEEDLEAILAHAQQHAQERYALLPRQAPPSLG